MPFRTSKSKASANQQNLHPGQNVTNHRYQQGRPQSPNQPRAHTPGKTGKTYQSKPHSRSQMQQPQHNQKQGYPHQQNRQSGHPHQQRGHQQGGQQYQQQGGHQGGYAPQYQQQQGGHQPRPQSNYVGGHPSPGNQSHYMHSGGYGGGPMMAQQAPMGSMPAGGGAVLMPAPAVIPGIPHGLEYLAAIDHIIVDQLVEMIELISNIEGANAYSLKNGFGQQAYFAMEESNPMMRQMMGKERQFTMRITDNWHREVIRVHRPFKQCGMPIDACIIECPLGVQIGRVVLQGFIAPLTLTVEDSFCRPMFLINGPICPMGNYGDQIFPITCTSTMQQVGSITKKFGGMAKEMYTDADTFVIIFPMSMDVYMKACILGANFLIDFLLYEDNHKQPGGMMMLR